MKKNVKRYIGDVQPYQPGKPIEAVKRELGLGNVIKLASNESPYGPSPKVIRAMKRSLKTVNRYPDGGCYYLRSALAKRLGIRQSQLIFGNGSDEIIVLAIRALVGSGDEVVVAQPSFLIYNIASRLSGARVKSIPLKNFHYDLSGMAQAVTKKTRIVFIGNPDNPAGTYVTHRQLEDFLCRIRKDILVFLDEAYFEYVQARNYPKSKVLLKFWKNLIVTRTFSKMYGLAGLRIGYGMADEGFIEVLNRLREPFNVNSLAQAAALACLSDQPYYRRIARLIKGERQYLAQELRRLGLNFVKSVTNFILIDVKRPSSQIVLRLLKKGIIIRDMAHWGLDRYIRVTIGTHDENRRFIQHLKGAITG